MPSLIQSIRHWFARRCCRWHTLVDLETANLNTGNSFYPPLREIVVTYSYRDSKGRELATLTPYPDGAYKLFLKDNASVYFVGSIEDLHGNVCPHCIRAAKKHVEQDYWNEVAMMEGAYS